MHNGERGARGQIRRIHARGHCASHAQTTQDSLANHQRQQNGHCRTGKLTCAAAPHRGGVRKHGSSNEHSKETMRVLIEDAALHFTDGIEQHVVAETVRPVRHC